MIATIFLCSVFSAFFLLSTQGLPQSPDGVFRLPPLLPNTSAPSSHSNSLTSTHGMGYWKADSQLPIATNPRPSSDSHRHRYSWQVKCIFNVTDMVFLYFCFD